MYLIYCIARNIMLFRLGLFRSKNSVVNMLEAKRVESAPLLCFAGGHSLVVEGSIPRLPSCNKLYCTGQDLTEPPKCDFFVLGLVFFCRCFSRTTRLVPSLARRSRPTPFLLRTRSGVCRCRLLGCPLTRSRLGRSGFRCARRRKTEPPRRQTSRCS